MHTKSAADANPLAKQYEDITLNCRDCNAEFIFPRASRSSTRARLENQPTRCTECKNAKKARPGEAVRRACVLRVPEGRVHARDAGRSRTPRAAAAAAASAPALPRRATRSRRASARAGMPAASRTTPTRRRPSARATGHAFQKGECTRGCLPPHDPNAEAPSARASRATRSRRASARAMPAASPTTERWRFERERADDETRKGDGNLKNLCLRVSSRPTQAPRRFLHFR